MLGFEQHCMVVDCNHDADAYGDGELFQVSPANYKNGKIALFDIEVWLCPHHTKTLLSCGTWNKRWTNNKKWKSNK